MAKMDSRRRFGSFVYTVATREDRSSDRGDAGVYTDWRKRPLDAVLGHLCTLLRRDSPRRQPTRTPEEPKKDMSLRIIWQEKPCSIGHGGIFLRLYMSHAWLGHVAPRPFDGLLVSGSR